jgi:hypothetical protein
VDEPLTKDEVLIGIGFFAVFLIRIGLVQLADVVNAMSKTLPIQWLPTEVNHQRPATGHDAGRSGRKLHAVKAYEDERLPPQRPGIDVRNSGHPMQFCWLR